MTGQEDSLRPDDWRKVAEKDWQRIRVMLREQDLEAAAYFLQQSLEKYLKAFLLEKGWKLRKTHELDALLDDAAKYNPKLENFRDLCERVSGYYLIDRYPPLVPSELTSEDISKDLEEAKELVAILLESEPPAQT